MSGAGAESLHTGTHARLRPEMRAACLTAFTGIDGVRLRAVATPRPGPDELLVEVRTVGANQLDLNTMNGRGPGARTRLPLVIGVDPAGVVVDQGSEVAGDRRGERVVVKPGIACGTCRWCLAGEDADCVRQTMIGVHRDGGAAEYVAVPARNAVPIGELDFATATAAVHSVPIALHAIRASGGVEPGSTVLVTGASGAVGSAAVQLAVLLGADVLAASTSLTVQGPRTRPVRYDDPDQLVTRVRDLAPDGVDLVVDATGHGGVIGAAMRVLAWRGRAVVCSASLDAGLEVDARALYLARHRLVGASSAGLDEVREGLRLVEDGSVTPLLGPELDLSDVAGAYAAVTDRSRSGKVVLRVS